MSMGGYLRGLGDRHPSNLMLDHYSGKLRHIDFGNYICMLCVLQLNLMHRCCCALCCILIVKLLPKLQDYLHASTNSKISESTTWQQSAAHAVLDFSQQSLLALCSSHSGSQLQHVRCSLCSTVAGVIAQQSHRQAAAG